MEGALASAQVCVGQMKATTVHQLLVFNRKFDHREWESMLVTYAGELTKLREGGGGNPAA